MRILIVTSFPIPGEYDGTAMLPIKILRALKTRGIDVVVAHLRAKPPFGRAYRGVFEGTPVYTLPPRRWGSGMRRIARDFPFDLVHAQHYGGATRAFLTCKKYQWPLVYEIHSLLGDEVERDKLGRGVPFQLTRMVEQWASRYAAGIIVLGQLVKDVLVNEKGLQAEKISVIYPGIDLAEFSTSDVPAIIPGISSEHKVIMYVGSIVHPNQGVSILINSLHRVFSTLPEARCVLVGGPAEIGEIYKTQLGPYANRLTILSNTTPEQVVSLCKRADVLVHPRLACRENFSVQSKIAVYLASGRPIVATNFGDYKTILGNSGAGLLTEVNPYALSVGIIEVLTNPILADQLSRAAIPVARELFAMDRNIDRYIDAYAKAISTFIPKTIRRRRKRRDEHGGLED